MLLSDFDRELNQKGIICIRFIDDFLILGSTQTAVIQAFKKAQKILKSHGLNAYVQSKNKSKARMGTLDSAGFDFLGCKTVRGQIRPNDKSKQRLLGCVDEIFKSSESLLNDLAKIRKEKKTVIETFSHVRNVLKGWGNQYSFCNHPQFVQDLDQKVAARKAAYVARHSVSMKDFDLQDQMRIFGIHQLIDSKSDPIIRGTKRARGATSKVIF